MEVSSSSDSMEGIEGFQGISSNATEEMKDSYDMSYSRILSSSGPMNCSFLTEEFVEASPSECAAYEKYLNLSEFTAIWKSREWHGWPAELLVKTALQSLEMTFRLISSVLCDTRPYINREEWKRRLESLTASQLELISVICEGDKDAPTVQLSVSNGVIATKVGQEVWQRPGALPVVSRVSQESLLPRLGTWKRAEHMVSRIWLVIETHMQRAPFTLGLGEPNLSGKPILEYDKICKPSYLYSFRQSSQFHNAEDHTLCTVHQIFEAWLFVAHLLLRRIHQRIDHEDSVGASKDCWTIERIWQLLTDIQNLFLLVDPDDFLCLKHQLSINRATSSSTSKGAYCLKSTALRSLTDACKELRNLVPKVMGVEADPKGGPRLQEAVLELFHSHRHTRRESPNGETSCGIIHILLAFQGIEAAVKRFFFSFQQLVIAVMSSAEMNRTTYLGASDALTQIYSEPPFFPSVDGAKIFLSDFWKHRTIAMGECMQKPVGKSNEATRKHEHQYVIP
ncbi:hypothetical protein SUGI_0878910 [Cryptomeria japonica]|uniref:nematode resistance protein-like HSPRO2 n=1 Tax=Cryptomeria japonica TaxID=3369 RepID=UPI00241476E7|nr:nematode resistance protein-like HSPRO2 [Cryptomeria japonica]GLJ42416.1 hypothetical protein SUGI_0878910 [Cryptomeria japonica]